MTRRALVFVALVVLLAACGGGGSKDKTAAKSGASGTTTTSTSAPATTKACTAAPIEQRAGAVLIVGLPAVTSSSDPVVAQVLDAQVSGVLITEPNVKSSAQLGQLVSDMKARAGRPIIVATGEETGRVSTFRAILGRSPSARALAAQRSPEGVQQFAQEWGSKMSALGINVDLAPVLDLDAGPSGGIIGDRSFSADPARASAYGVAYARGLAAANVRAVAKHFPGHGRSKDDSHLGLAKVDASVDELRATDLKPFADAFAADVPAVMLDHVAYTALDPELPASLSPKAYALLRSMGFKGAAITDSVGMGAVNLKWGFEEATIMAVAAGADGVLTTDGTKARSMRDALVNAVKNGRVPEARLNEAASRMAKLAGRTDAAAFACA